MNSLPGACSIVALESWSHFWSRKEIIVIVQRGSRPGIQLCLVRPLSLKGTSELIYKDAAASIRRTGQDFHYQLIIQRAHEEGEAELLVEEDGEDESGDTLDIDKDEKIFPLDQSLHFVSEIRDNVRDNGEKVFAWQDLGGGPGDKLLLNHSTAFQFGLHFLH